MTDENRKIIEKLAEQILWAAGECSIQLNKWENTDKNLGMSPAIAMAKAIHERK
jgi:hypothetical protein